MAKVSGGIRGGLSIEAQASATISGVIADFKSKGYSRQRPFEIGKVEKEIKDYAREHNIELGSNDIVMTADQIGHTLRDSKVRDDKAISPEHLVEFPMRRSGMEIYHDKTDNKFIYFDRSRNEKFVVHPNYSMKINRERVRHVNYITASKTDPTEFNMQKYRRIK